MLKSALRKSYLLRQKSLSPVERETTSRHLAEQFFNHFSPANSKHLHLFLSIEKNGEVDTRFIFQKLWRDFPATETFVPRLQGENLEHLEFKKETELLKNNWGILEPVGHELIDEKLFDVVIVPLLCFDKSGYRVGYGKGFYDKFLSKCRPDCQKIGVSFFEPVEKISDINQFDVKLNYCLTPNRIWRV